MANQPDPPTVTRSARKIFLRVLDADGDERDTLLDSACGDDKIVREEVESLLAESGTVGDFLNSPAVITNREPPKIEIPSIGQLARESSGDQIGPFKLGELLGEGGCGMVYAAEQQQPVRREVALKIIKLGMDTNSVIARFESERQALAMMDHPHIAKVLDAGATDAGRPYFVMELVRGVPITDFCDQQNLSTSGRLRLFIQVCNAIQHAHQKGIIHRDIKPSNILIADGDDGPAPKVIDFGIAKATEQRLTERTLFTAVEAFIGTPTYMSPEQAEVGGLDIDTRSDIYALGVLLHELLVGQPPFDASELQSLSLDEMRRTIRETEPERPSSKLGSLPKPEQERVASARATDAPKLSGLLRGDLDWIVMKCLEKDRSRRYPTAGGLVADIERHLDGQPVLARPPSKIYRAKKLVRRHRGAITAGSLLLLMLLGGIGFSTAQAIRAKRAEQDAQRGRELQEELRIKAERGEQAAKTNEYVAEIKLTQLALSEGNFGRARQLIDKHLPAPGATDYRGFEWRYLADRCRGDEHIALPNEGGSVRCLAYSPNGRTLAVGLGDSVSLWDVRTRERITTLPGGANSLVFLNDGSTLASSNGDSTWIVNTETWFEVDELPGESGPLALSADGTQLATTNREGIRIWDTTDWFELMRLPDSLPGPRAFSPDGKMLAAMGKGGITLWSLKSGNALRVLEDSEDLFGGNPIGGLRFSANGRQIIAPRNTNSERGIFVLNLWDVETGKDVGILPNDPGHAGAIAALDSDRSGELLATASLDHSVGLWDLARQVAITNLNGHRSEVWSVALSPDGRTVASGSKDGDLRLWPTSPPTERDMIERNLIPLTFSQDGRQLATADTSGLITIYRLPGLEPVRTYRAAADASMSANLNRIARPEEDGNVTILSGDAVEEFSVVVPGERKLDLVKLSPDGRHLLTHSRLQPLRLWDLSQPEKAILEIAAESAIISADGNTVASFSLGNRVEIWDLSRRRIVRELSVPHSFGFSAALSHDGTLVALSSGVADSENIISLWDTESGKRLGTFAGHKQSVRSIAFTPDSRTLASASGDGSLKLWNVATNQELLSVRELGSSLRHLRFSPDGQWLVGSTGEQLRFFHAPAPGA